MDDVFTILRRTSQRLTHPPSGRHSDRPSGRGGTLGTPSFLLDEAPPGGDQEGNWVVSGGGLVAPHDDEPPADAAHRSPSASAPRRS